LGSHQQKTEQRHSIGNEFDEDAAMTLSDIPAALTGERTMTKNTDGRHRPSRDEIAHLAYNLYETRGRQHGHDVEDWLFAERELTYHYRLAPEGIAAVSRQRLRASARK
jgi:hypothetical protein